MVYGFAIVTGCLLILYCLCWFPSLAPADYVQTGAHVQLWPCSDNPSDPRQSWSFPTTTSTSIVLISDEIITQVHRDPYRHVTGVERLVQSKTRHLGNDKRRIDTKMKMIATATINDKPFCVFPETISAHNDHDRSMMVVGGSNLAIDGGADNWYLNNPNGNAYQTFKVIPLSINNTIIDSHDDNDDVRPDDDMNIFLLNAGSGGCMTVDIDWLTYPNSPYFSGIPLRSTPCPDPTHNSSLTSPALWTYRSTTNHYYHPISGMCLDADSVNDCSHPMLSSLPYCNSSLSAPTRAKDLVSRMTTIEKVNYLVSDTVFGKVNRLGIPELGSSECLHGVQNEGIPQTGAPGTNFPSPMALSRSWSPSLIYDVGRAVSDELRSKSNDISRPHDREGQMNISNYGRVGQGGGLVCWAPVINICRDPRWGRCQESWGEDPYLTHMLANAYVNALQQGPDIRYKQAISTLKHFVVHSGPDSIPLPRQSFDVQVYQRDLLDSYSVAFKAALHGNGSGLMCAYSAVDGIPMCAQRDLITNMARDEWEWDGYVVSDCTAITQIYTEHKYTNNLQEAIMAALSAGVDWACGGEYWNLYQYIQQGYLLEDSINPAVIRMMTLLIELGLLETNLTDIVYNDGTIYNQIKQEIEHRPLAQLSAAQSIVLLENKPSPNNNSRPTLPLTLSPGLRVGIFGPCADNYCCSRGSYDALPMTVTTFAAGFVNASRNPNHPFYGITVVNATACSSAPDYMWPDISCSDNSHFQSAYELADTVDIIIATIGVDVELEHESGDRLNLTLPGYQEQLVAGLYARSRIYPNKTKPLIVVLNSGTQTISPVSMVFADAVLHTGYLGTQAGAGLVDILSGLVIPAARLTEVWYKDIDIDLPPYINYDYKAAPYGRGYRYNIARPAYTFAYSMSYTSFIYTIISDMPSSIHVCDSLPISIQISNIGNYTADHIIPIFLAPRSFIPPPSLAVDTTYRYKLIAFERIQNLCAQCNTIITFNITAVDRSILDPISEYEPTVQADTWDIHTGGLPTNVTADEHADWLNQYNKAVSSGNINPASGMALLQHAGWGWEKGCGGGIVQCLQATIMVTGTKTPVSLCGK